MNWIKIECPYCHQRIPLSSVHCPQCRAVIPHECGEREREKVIRVGLLFFGIIFVGFTAFLLYLFLTVLA